MGSCGMLYICKEYSQRKNKCFLVASFCIITLLSFKYQKLHRVLHLSCIYIGDSREGEVVSWIKHLNIFGISTVQKIKTIYRNKIKYHVQCQNMIKWSHCGDTKRHYHVSTVCKSRIKTVIDHLLETLVTYGI